jgi:hypothetical protein
MTANGTADMRVTLLGSFLGWITLQSRVCYAAIHPMTYNLMIQKFILPKVIYSISDHFEPVLRRGSCTGLVEPQPSRDAAPASNSMYNFARPLNNKLYSLPVHIYNHFNH